MFNINNKLMPLLNMAIRLAEIIYPYHSIKVISAQRYIDGQHDEYYYKYTPEELTITILVNDLHNMVYYEPSNEDYKGCATRQEKFVKYKDVMGVYYGVSLMFSKLFGDDKIRLKHSDDELRQLIYGQ